MTMQIGDTLLWQGVEHVLPHGGPLLEAWPEKDRPEFEAMSTACWRGFIATWLVDDDGWLRITSVRTGVEMRAVPGPAEPKLSKAAAKKLREDQRQRTIESFPPGERPSEEVIDQMLEWLGTLGGRKMKMVMGASERLYELFPGRDASVTATWFTGELVAGYGEIVERDLYSIYAHYRSFAVNRGRVTCTEDHDNNWWKARHGIS